MEMICKKSLEQICNPKLTAVEVEVVAQRTGTRDGALLYNSIPTLVGWVSGAAVSGTDR